MMFWYGNGMSGWGYGLMTAGMIVFWGLVIAGAVILVRYVAGGMRGTDDRPEQILAERFARGEIDEQDYRSRLATLRGGPRPAGHP